MLWIVFILFLFFLIKFLLNPYIVLNVNLDSIDKFYYLLLNKGYCEDSWLLNGTINLSIFSEKESQFIQFGLSKYKENGNIGVFLVLPIESFFKNKEKILLKKLSIDKVEYFFVKSDVKNVKHALFIDLKKDLNLLKNIIGFIYKNIFEIDSISFVLNLDRIGKGNSNATSCSPDIESFDNINIDIPLTNWDLLLCKLGIKKYSGGCGYPKKNDIITNKKK